MVQEESFLEVRQETNQPGTLALAIRLEAGRAALWQTNLAEALESLTGARITPTTDGWTAVVQSPKSKVQGPKSKVLSLKSKVQSPEAEGSPEAEVQSPKSNVQSPESEVQSREAEVQSWEVALRRAGEWTVLALGPAAASNELSTLNPQLSTNLVFNRATRRLEPVPASQESNIWFEAGIDLRRVAGALALRWDLPEDLPSLFLELTGNGKDVLTRGRLDFPKPLALDLEPWNTPTNLVHDPLCSFTAIRGFQPWLASLKAWQNLQVGAPPNQLFCWAQPGTVPFMTYFAAPLPDASNRVYSVGERLLRECNPWITNYTFGRSNGPPTTTGLLG